MSSQTNISEALKVLIDADSGSLSDAIKNLNLEKSKVDKFINNLSTATTTTTTTTPRRRTAKVERKTKETEIKVELDLDGTGENVHINTGIGFLDHMFHAVGKHGRIDINMECKGDLDIDDHHTAEDCAIVFGKALDIALGDRKGINRYGSAYAPLDESLSLSVIDISSRPFCHIDMKGLLKRDKIGKLSTEMIPHIFQSIAISSRITLHINVLYGDNDHHISESSFKSFAIALRYAISIDHSRSDIIPSTKESL